MCATLALARCRPSSGTVLTSAFKYLCQLALVIYFGHPPPTWQATVQSTTWNDLPPDVRDSIIAKVAGSEPLETGNLRHMAVSREWLRATRNGVKALNLCRITDPTLTAAFVPSPSQLSHFPNLETLIVGAISAAPIECSVAPSLPNLKVLHYTYGVGLFNDTCKRYLHTVLQGCVQLRELRCDFSVYQFHLLREIASHTALTSLSLHSQGGCREDSWGGLLGRASLRDTISRLVCLQELTLCAPTPISIPSACFSPDSRLRSITLRCGKLQRLPSTFTTLQRLESLELDVDSFRRPPDLTLLTSLTSLVIHDSQREGEALDFRPLFSDLPWLRVLVVRSRNALEQVPAEIGCYTRLEALRLSFSEISSLPEPFGQLSSLKWLTLEGCSLSCLPETFSQLQQLNVLRLVSQYQPQELVETVELPGTLNSLEVGRSLLHQPDSLWSCLSLQELEVANLESASLPEAMGQLTSLTKLTVSLCRNLRSLPASLHLLPLLQSVALEYCGALTRVAPPQGPTPRFLNGDGVVHTGAVPLLDFLIHLSSLTSLTLHSCHGLEGIPRLRLYSSSSSSSRLTRMRISKCSNLAHLPHSLGSLSSLTYLEVATCTKLRSLPESLGSLSSLASLKLKSLGLTSLPHTLRSLPHSFGHLGQLTSLAVQDCTLELLPASQGRLSSLQELLIDGEGITLTPDFLRNLPALTSLELVRLREFPALTGLSSRQAPGLELFSSLKALAFTHCEELQQLPPHVWHITSLTSLRMYDCKKLCCHADSVLDMPALERLEVIRVDLNAFPRAVSCLSNLTSLILDSVTSRDSSITLPGWVCHLPALKHLSVEDNRMAALPEGLGGLSMLESLRITGPRLTDLPMSLGQLSKLTALALVNCVKLQHLPDSFTQLVALKRVGLTDCKSLVRVPLVDGQLPGRCELLVRRCRLLNLHVNGRDE